MSNFYGDPQRPANGQPQQLGLQRPTPYGGLQQAGQYEVGPEQRHPRPAPPQGPAHLQTPPAGSPTAAKSRGPRRKRRPMVLPVAAIAIGLFTTFFFLLAVGLSANVEGTDLGFVAATAVLLIALLILWWLDRWEPEPVVLLVAAFLWGSGIATSLSLPFTLMTPFLAPSPDAGIWLQAPVVEEFTKGLFILLLVAGKRGRFEFNALTDGVIYGVLVGAGFSFLEDQLYIASTTTFDQSAELASIRIGGSALGHGLYTMCFSLGIWFAMNRRSVLARIGCGVGGYAVAVLLHGIHNGAAVAAGTSDDMTLFYLVKAFTFVVLVALAVIAWFARRHEGRLIAAELPRMAEVGLISAQEVSWMSSLKGRRDHLKSLPKPARADAKSLIEAVTELAFLEHRIARIGGPVAPVLQQQRGELGSVIQGTTAALTAAGLR